MSDHAKFSPSGASRWLACPGSVALEAECPDTSSAYAEEGTYAHTILERVLLARIDGRTGQPARSAGQTVTVGERTFVVDRDMASHVNEVADYAFAISDAPGVVREAEQRVYFGDYIGVPNEDAFGTCDFSWVNFDKGEIGWSISNTGWASRSSLRPTSR